MAWWDAVLGDISVLLSGLGLEVSVSVLRVFLIAVLVVVLFQVVRWVFGLLDGVVAWLRTQVRERTWRNAGRLSSSVSLLLLVLAYGLFPAGQPLGPAEQAERLVGGFLGSIAPAAILTQALVLGVSWLVLGALAGVRGRELAEPFTTALAGTAMLAVLFLLSVVPFVVTGGDVEALGTAAAVLALVLLVAVGVFGSVMERRLRRQGTVTATASVPAPGSPRRAMLTGVAVAFGGLVLLAAIIALPTAWIYASVAPDPSAAGLVAVDLAIASVVFLFTCFMFRSYLADAAGAPPVVGHLIDLCLAVSAAALALTGSPALEVALGTVPAIVVGALPGLVVAAMIAVLHLRPAWSPRVGAGVAVAVGLGLLVASLREVLSGWDLAAWLPLANG